MASINHEHLSECPLDLGPRTDAVQQCSVAKAMKSCNAKFSGHPVAAKKASDNLLAQRLSESIIHKWAGVAVNPGASDPKSGGEESIKPAPIDARNDFTGR